MLDLWHAAGRAAGDRQKRRVALLGVLSSAPALLAGAFLSHFLRDPASALEGVGRPLGYIVAPLRKAYEGDHDVALLGYLALQGLLLSLVWGVFGGALQRLAAVDLTQGRREETPAAFAFARRHWRAFVGCKAALFVGTIAPLAAAAAIATVGRIDGAPGGILLAVVAVFALIFVAIGVVLGSSWLVAGFLTTPVIACEDSGAFDGLSRTFGYAGAGVPRLTLWRLAFFGGVLIGALWRALRMIVIVGVTLAVLRLGAGADVLERAHAVLGARGEPADAARLGITFGDYALAFVLALLLFALVATWLAQFISRIACARVAVYLGLRERIDGVARDVLHTPPEAPAFADADAAGFDEVARVGPPDVHAAEA